ncbi:hypothetical protein F2Q65_14105 [Thiohalocapsa marina]|uniref:Uncharacterized protein n=1 Tax=Thiohalocapsa marina TaxID=424902 RepID=A0A5M8FJN8_9GAMM|nr:hypothetical protein [Thiohalocapsa marina]KAA6183936.1 hypothetical protein F2Q65_14105 [Thiohalocapsa marina]
MITLHTMQIDKDDHLCLDPDQIGLQPGLYARLFGRRFGADDRGQPWRRGIVRVSYRRPGEATRSVRLLFRGVSIEGLTQNQCLLPGRACQQLGLGNESAEIHVSVEPRAWSRFWFYWSHPVDATRVAFKLGAVAIGIALMPIIIPIIL